MRGWGMAAVALAACGRVGFHADVTGDAAGGGDTGDAPSGGPIQFVAATSGSGSAPSAQLSLGAARAGDLVVLPISTYSDPDGPLLTAVTDDRDDSYTIVGPYDGDGARGYMAYATIGNAKSEGESSLTATVTLDQTVDFFDIRMQEYANVTSQLDVVAGAQGNDKGSAAAHLMLTTSTPNDLIVALVIAASDSSAGSGFTQRTELDDDITEDEVAPTAGVYAVTANITIKAGWDLVAAAFHGR